MAVVIRMKRTGRRNRPCYRIDVSDSRSPRDGRTLENLGLYDPISRKTEAQVSVNAERARYWLSVGALPSETVRSIFKREGVWQAPPKVKRDRSGRKKVTKAGTARTEQKKLRAEKKLARCTERKTARRAAAREAAAAEGESSEE